MVLNLPLDTKEKTWQLSFCYKRKTVASIIQEKFVLVLACHGQIGKYIQLKRGDLLFIYL